MFRKKPTPPPGRKRPARTSQPQSYSYHARRSDEGIPTGRMIARSEAAAKARSAGRYWRQRFGFGILLLTTFACLVYVSTLSMDSRAVLQSSESSRPVLQAPVVYEQAANKLLESSFWNRNKITVDSALVSKELAKQFPELANVAVVLPILTHRPVVYAEAAEPVLIMATTNGSFALDARGSALITGAQLASLSGLNLPLVTDQSGLPIKLRRQALTGDNVSFIQTVISQLKERALSIESLTLPAGTSELDVRIKGQGYAVKFNLAHNSALQQVGTYLAVYDRLQAEHTTPSEYIDVRVTGRAYYK